MDLSESMEDDLAELKVFSKDLLVKLGHLSDNFQIGFGSYVDKSTTPYTYPKAE